jgi:hypothetical protein
MGLLFTTEGTRRIINTLNTAFDGPGSGLDAIRAAVSGNAKLAKKVAKRTWKPGHFAWMLQLLPYDQGSTSYDGQGNQVQNSGQPLQPRDRKRWHYFLRSMGYTDSTFQTLTPLFTTLRDALADAILNTDSQGNPLKDPTGAQKTIARIVVDHVELENANDIPNVVIFDTSLPSAGTGAWVRHITLFTAPVPLSQTGTDFGGSDDPPENDDAPPITGPYPWKGGG